MTIHRPNVALIAMMLAMLSACARRERVVLAQPAPDLAPQFNNISVGGEMYFAGQPTREGLAELRARGVKNVISLRTEQEHAERVGFDERAEAERLGMRFINLPMSEDTSLEELVDSLDAQLKRTSGATLLHCGSSNRAGTIWAAYLMEKRGMPLEEALVHARAAGLSAEANEAKLRELAQRLGHAPK